MGGLRPRDYLISESGCKRTILSHSSCNQRRYYQPSLFPDEALTYGSSSLALYVLIRTVNRQGLAILSEQYPPRLIGAKKKLAVPLDPNGRPDFSIAGSYISLKLCLVVTLDPFADRHDSRERKGDLGTILYFRRNFRDNFRRSLPHDFKASIYYSHDGLHTRKIVEKKQIQQMQVILAPMQTPIAASDLALGLDTDPAV